MLKLSVWMMLLFVIAPVSGCASRQPVGLEFCALASPIYVEEGDEFTDLTARAILAHNERGARLCGWS